MRSPNQTRLLFLAAAVVFLCVGFACASTGDRLPEFGDCVSVSPPSWPLDLNTPAPTDNSCRSVATPTADEAGTRKSVCQNHNLAQKEHELRPGTATAQLHQLLLWDCTSECDYTCQHIISDARVARQPPYAEPVVQYHGKWPFWRFLGMQEPFSVLFSLANLAAHVWGIGQLRQHIPASYRLRKYYLAFGYMGYVSWIASAVFHTRDFTLTERVDYFGAALSVLYGFYFAPIRVFRLDDPKGNQPWKASVVRLWTLVCVALYAAHVSYLSFWRWDYTYNMAANIAVGIAQNILWTGFAWSRYMKSGKFWQAWPGLIVAWIILAMSMEVLDFAPWGLMVDAHSLWHLGTVGPTFWWYNFLIRDAQEDLAMSKSKA